jgi:hypothetical protein
VWCGRLSVVEDEPVGELAVEERKVGKEQLLMVVHEGLLDRAIEALGWAFILGVLG